MRTLTLTVRTETGRLIPVRTAEPIPRACLMEAVKILQDITLPERSFTCGEIIHEDLMGTKVVVTADC
jgi:CxxC motif-containing protein